MASCLFCKMINGEIKPDIVYENEAVLAFRDINPQAPVHVLVVPKKHIATLNDLQPEHDVLVGELYLAAKRVAERIRRLIGSLDSGEPDLAEKHQVKVLESLHRRVKTPA